MLNKKYIENFKSAKIFNTFYKSERNPSLLKGSAKLISVQVISAFLLMLNNYLLVQLTGENTYGSYVYIYTWVSLFSVVVLFGMDDFFIANLPRYYFNKANSKTVFKILSWSIIIVLLAFGVTALIVYLFFYINILNSIYYNNQLLFYIFLLELSLLNLQISFLRGINIIVVGQVLDKILRPALMTFLLLICLMLSFKVSIQEVLLFQLGILGFLLLIFSILILKQKKINVSVAAPFDKTLRSNVIYLLISLLYLLSVRLDILFLSNRVAPESIGHYNLAVRFADIIGYPITAVSLMLPTMIAKEKWTDKKILASFLNSVSLFSLVVTLLVLCVFSIGSKPILHLFGKNFITGYWPMLILGVTYLIASFSFPLNAYFMVSGQQRISLICLSISVTVTFLACYFLIPILLLNGAALSVLAGSIVYYLALKTAFIKTKTPNNI